MRKEITIGETNVEMAASAATPFLFKQIFKRDFLREAQSDQASDELYIMLGFVMSQKPEDILRGQVSEDDFFAWLEQYEYMDMINATPDMINLYVTQKKGTSVPKKQAD